MRGKRAKLGEGDPETNLGFFTPIPIRDFYVQDCFVLEKFVVP